MEFKAHWQPIYDQRDIDEYNGLDIGPNPTNIRPEEFVINTETGDVTYHPYCTLKERIFFEKIENQKIKCSKRATRVLLRLAYAKTPELEDRYREVFEARIKEYEKLCEKVLGPPPDENGMVDAAHLLEFTPDQLENYEQLLRMRKKSEQRIEKLKISLVKHLENKSICKMLIKESQNTIDTWNETLNFTKVRF